MNDSINIIRVEHSKENPYFMMNRDTAQDDTLTWEARGVLAYLLSKPDDWQVMVVDLQQNCGRDKVRHILDELKEARYLKIIPARNEAGKFSKAEYQVFEQPYTENPTTVTPVTGLPTTAKPATAKRPLQNKEGQKTEKQNKDKTKKDISPKPPKRLSYPQNPKSWEWKHIEQYACDNPSIELLTAFDNSQLKNMPTALYAMDVITLFKELQRLKIASDRWKSLYTAGAAIKHQASIFKRMMWALPDWIKKEPTITVVPPPVNGEYVRPLSPAQLREKEALEKAEKERAS